MRESPSDDHELDSAVAALRAGLLVAFPTETVYGLGANARDPAAVARLYAAKGRPADHPVIVHIANAEALAHWARNIPPVARTLAARFWPGPLTLVLQRASGVRDAITGGQDTVAVRCPDHPVALALLRAAYAAGIDGIVAPSANRFGRLSPTTAAHVVEELGAAVAVVLDGGPCAIGIESTIVDVSSGVPHVLRPGMLTAEDLQACVGDLDARLAGVAPRVSGALPAHYAPATPLELVAAGDCEARVNELRARGEIVALLASAAVLGACRLPAHAREAPMRPDRYAQQLYATLRELDAAGCTRLVVERPPATPPWRGIIDRLTRAARGSHPASS